MAEFLLWKTRNGPRPHLWKARNEIMMASRRDEFVAGRLKVAGELGMTGDACFVFLAAELMKDREARRSKDQIP